jgi:hypothetical protein
MPELGRRLPEQIEESHGRRTSDGSREAGSRLDDGLVAKSGEPCQILLETFDGP